MSLRDFVRRRLPLLTFDLTAWWWWVTVLLAPLPTLLHTLTESESSNFFLRSWTGAVGISSTSLLQAERKEGGVVSLRSWRLQAEEEGCRSEGRISLEGRRCC